MYVMRRLFEATKMIGQAMARKLQAFLDKYNLSHKILTCEKQRIQLENDDHDFEKFVVSCDNLGLKEPFQGTYFGHAMLKVCQIWYNI
jgi:hypothetical protein